MKNKIIILGILTVVVLIVLGVALFNFNKKDNVYTVIVSNIDDYSPDVYLTIYENDEPIKVSKIYYLDGVEIVTSFNESNIVTNKFDIINEKKVILELIGEKKVKADVKYIDSKK